jgi:hypothetical protein
VKRSLVDLTFFDLWLLDLASVDPCVAATGATKGQLVDVLLMGDLGRLTGDQLPALHAFLERFILDKEARQIFQRMMAEPKGAGMRISQFKKRSTPTSGANLPRAGEPGAGGSSGPGDHENKEVKDGRRDRSK